MIRERGLLPFSQEAMPAKKSKGGSKTQKPLSLSFSIR